MPSASDPRQPNRQGQPTPRPVSSGQRPMQPTQRAAQPAARPAQPSSRAAQSAQRPAQQPAARAARPASGARFKQQAPTQRAQAPQSHTRTHHAHGTHGVAPATRSSYNTHARRGVQKKSSPVPMIIGGVIAVLALVAIVFFVVPASRASLPARMRKLLLASKLLSRFPMAPRVIPSLRFSPRTISSKTPRIIMRRSKSSMPICRLSLAPTRLPRSWTRPRLFSSSWKAPMRAPMR